MKTKIIALITMLSSILPLIVSASSHDAEPAWKPGDEVPLLMPGTKMTFKLWETQQISDDVYTFRFSFYRNIFVVTDNGVIAALGDAADVLAAHPDVEVDEFPNMLIVSGLVDCHVHFPQVDIDIRMHREQVGRRTQCRNHPVFSDQ